ncbi:hypothetical protein LZ31DRAFT_601669 [Colletotrichum somersetense]|nr:hypothetical protein LZ31DRAFT_601669 [Colletotrichum somersetense]
MRMIQSQNTTILQLLAERPATARQYEHPPAYACGTLHEDSTPEQVADWLAAIEAGNRLRTATDQHYVEWALTKVTSSLQTQWRNHHFTLDVMGETNLWASFEAFIRRSHVDPELQERRLYGQLHDACQGAEQSPLRFFAEWSAIHQALGTNYEDSRALAFAFFYCLQPQLQRALTGWTGTGWTGIPPYLIGDQSPKSRQARGPG